MMVTAPRAGRDAAVLAMLAEPLEPQRLPFYIKGNPDGHPDGWYWQAAGAAGPSYLGRNVVWAERKLVTLLRPQETAA